MITTWRIVKAKYSATAFDGEAARLLGGRWNSPGRPVIYTAESPSLAALEILVHLDPQLLSAYVRIPCMFSESLVQPVDVSTLPEHWKTYPAPTELQQIGDAWLHATPSAVLRVPSAVTEIEFNYLLNPAHPDFPRITIGNPSPFEFDARLFKK